MSKREIANAVVKLVSEGHLDEEHEVGPGDVQDALRRAWEMGAKEATGRATPKPLTRANLLCDGCGRDDGTHIGERGNGWILRCVTCHLSVDGDTEVEARGRWQGLMRRMGGAPEPARVLGPLTVLPTSAGFDILQDSQSGRLYALCEDDDGWPTLRPVVVEVADV